MLELRDKMDERIAQLDALLVLMTAGTDDPQSEGAEMLVLSQFSNDIQHRVMWLASSLANEIHDINGQLTSAKLAEVRHG